MGRAGRVELIIGGSRHSNSNVARAGVDHKCVDERREECLELGRTTAWSKREFQRERALDLGSPPRPPQRRGASSRHEQTRLAGREEGGGGEEGEKGRRLEVPLRRCVSARAFPRLERTKRPGALRSLVARVECDGHRAVYKLAVVVVASGKHIRGRK